MMTLSTAELVRDAWRFDLASYARRCSGGDWRPLRHLVHAIDIVQAARFLEAKKQNQGLMNKYGVRGFPTILILDPEGNLVQRTGYQPNQRPVN